MYCLELEQILVLNLHHIQFTEDRLGAGVITGTFWPVSIYKNIVSIVSSLILARHYQHGWLLYVDCVLNLIT